MICKYIWRNSMKINLSNLSIGNTKKHRGKFAVFHRIFSPSHTRHNCDKLNRADGAIQSNETDQHRKSDNKNVSAKCMKNFPEKFHEVFRDLDYQESIRRNGAPLHRCTRPKVQWAVRERRGPRGACSVQVMRHPRGAERHPPPPFAPRGHAPR